MIYHKYDEQGEWIAGEEVNAETQPMGNYTNVPLPVPNWKPIFNEEKNEWIESDMDSYNHWLNTKDLPVEEVIIKSDSEKIEELQSIVDQLLLDSLMGV